METQPDNALASPALPAPPSRAAYPSLRQAVLLSLLFLAVQITSGIAIMAGAGIAGAIARRTFEAQALTISVANLFAFWVVLRFGAERARRTMLQVALLRPVPLILVVPAFATAVGAHILLSEVNNLVERVAPSPEWLRNLFGGEHDLGGDWAVLFAIGVVAPLTEEVFFRGLALRGFVQRFRPWTANAAAALLFAVIHLNVWQAPGAFALGLIFGWWTLRTGSLLLALMGHAVANVFPTLAIWLLHWDEIPGYAIRSDQGIVGQPPWFNALGALLLVVGILVTRLLFARMPGSTLQEVLAVEADAASDPAAR